MISPWQKPFRGMQINKAHPLAKGLVGCWTFNERTGDKVFDLSGNGNTSTIYGADWVPDGLDFVAVNNDYIDLSPTSILSTLVDSSIVIVFNTDLADGGTSGKALYCERNAGTPIFKFQIKQGFTQVEFVHRDNAGTLTFISGTTNICDGNDHNIVFSKNGTSVKLYVDGLYDGGGTLNGNDVLTTGDVRFGGDSQDANADYDGVINTGYIYDRTLSPDEVAYLHREPYAMIQQPISPASLFYEAAPPIGAIMNQFQGASIGADLFNGALL